MIDNIKDNKIDVFKENVDMNSGSIKTLEVSYGEAIEIYDKGEVAYKNKKYSTAIKLANEATARINTLQPAFDDIFVSSQNNQKIKIEARTTIDTAFNLMDQIKDNYLDKIGLTVSEEVMEKKIGTNAQFYIQEIESHDRAEKAYQDAQYLEAIKLANESIEFGNMFKDKLKEIFELK